MRNTVIAAASALIIWCGSAHAYPPPGVHDLVGASAAGGETQLQSRNYRLERNHGLSSYWWNAAEALCVRVVTANGRYASVDLVTPRECGRSSYIAHIDRQSGCPVDTSQADGYSYPDCYRGNYSVRAPVPPVALHACMMGADSYQNVAHGTTVVNGATMYGPDWVLKLASGGEYKSTCWVTPAGIVVEIRAGW